MIIDKIVGIVIKQSGFILWEIWFKIIAWFFILFLVFDLCVFHGTNSMSSNISYQGIFFHNNDKIMLHFPFLKSLVLTRCCLSGALIQNLSLLIENQLDELTLTFDKDAFHALQHELPTVNRKYNKK